MKCRQPRSVLLQVAGIIALAAWPCWAALPVDVIFPGEWQGMVVQKGIREPSGLVYHPGRATLFVVGDEGDIYEVRLSGEIVAHKKPEKRRDLEGITCDPSTGLLYVVVEGEERILEVDPASLEVRREFAIPRRFQGKTVMAPGGQGVEGIAFVPDSDHPEGGRFFVCNQAFSLADSEEASALFELALPIRSRRDGGEARIVRQFSPGVIDLADLCYDPAGKQLLVVSDATNSVWRIDLDGATIIAGYAFPGKDQEGIAVDPAGNLYVAQDSGGIFRLSWSRNKSEEKR